MKSLTEQIIELMPEIDKYHEDYSEGFNQARTEMINKIPEILSLIREIVNEVKYRDDYGDEIIDVQTLLEKLK
jgi:hypothetical protein